MKGAGVRAGPGHSQEGPQDQRDPYFQPRGLGHFPFSLHIYGMPGLFFSPFFWKVPCSL